MLIIGCDFHPGFQQVAIFDNRTGEIQEKRLQHRGEAEAFYRSLAGQRVQVGMEACGHYPWFERLLAELGMELRMGDAAKVRAGVVRKQKTDRRDAEHLLRLLLEDRFPQIWVPSLEVRDVRQLLVHRHKQVQARTRTKNQLQAMALSQGVQKKRRLWTQAGREELEQLPLLPYAAQRRQQLLRALEGLEAEIGELDRRVAEEARQRPEAVRLMTHPGVGPVTALALVLTLGPAERFGSAKQGGSYFGLIPSEESSGGKQRLGRISKQGSSFLRFLLVEAGQTAARLDPQLQRFYRRLAAHKNRSVAKVAVARKLATRLYLMLREHWTYAQLCQAIMQVSPSHSVAGQ
ncbi:MAG TPA: IS110 family transposase [Candidatus Sulfotelmatobacter sp.]|nr:IS110 family transposase [Candidatus Sulfotelmatobacter sp.]